MAKLFVILISLSNLTFAQDFWPSEYPDNINKFIYSETHSKCAYSDYIDGIVSDEIMDFPRGRTYTADFSVYGDVGNGYIVIDQTFQGDLHLSELVCPKL